MLDLANAHVPCHNPLFSYPGLAAPVSPVEPTGGEVGSTQWCRWPAQAWGSVGGDTGENFSFLEPVRWPGAGSSDAASDPLGARHTQPPTHPSCDRLPSTDQAQVMRQQ